MRPRKHVVIDLDEPVGSMMASGDRRIALHEAYKKHAAELTSIEDRLSKFLLVILGLFGAGATAITNSHLTPLPAWVLGITVAAISVFAIHYNSEIHALRIVVRELLVRCEMAMEFYKEGAFLRDEMLYTLAELDYAKKGKFLKTTSAMCIVAAGGGLILLIYLVCNTKC